MITQSTLTRLINESSNPDRCNYHCPEGFRCSLSNGVPHLHVCNMGNGACDCHTQQRYAGEKDTLSYKLIHGIELERISLKILDSSFGESHVRNENNKSDKSSMEVTSEEKTNL